MELCRELFIRGGSEGEKKIKKKSNYCLKGSYKLPKLRSFFNNKEIGM